MQSVLHFILNVYFFPTIICLLQTNVNLLYYSYLDTKQGTKNKTVIHLKFNTANLITNKTRTDADYVGNIARSLRIRMTKDIGCHFFGGQNFTIYLPLINVYKNINNNTDTIRRFWEPKETKV